MHTDSNDLARRLDSLERENRRLKRFGVGLLGIVGLVGLTSMVAPRLCKTVWAERFVLNDGSGNTRLMLDAYRTGAPVITATDKDGKTFAKVTLAGESPSLEFFDKEGNCAGKIGITEGEPYVERGKADSVAMR